MTTYTDWSPGRSVSESAALYTQLVNNRRHPTTRPARLDQPERDAAQQLPCPRSPATSGPLSHHRFGFNADACAFCDEPPAWILAEPQTGQTT